MRYTKIIIGVVVSLIMLSGINAVFALNEKTLRTSVISIDDIIEEKEAEKTSEENKNSFEICGFTAPEDPDYDAEFITVRRKLRVEPGEQFRVKVFIKNAGNITWFSTNSNCAGPKISLGSDNPRDRKSDIFPTNRISMDQMRIDPGQIASFTFYATAGDEPDVYKEYYTPMAEAITWMDNGNFYYDVFVGDVEVSNADLRKKLDYAIESGSVMDINLDGEKKIVVDLSDQRMFVYLDDRNIRVFPVSTGASKTPTPTGTTHIMLKQEVRVGHKYPHYVMPKFMMFRAGGYGMHALPSLANDGGVFWTEARNHIGIPVSHGCIRLLPEDADWLYDFTPIGAEVKVQW